jgi:hypothetical protein
MYALVPGILVSYLEGRHKQTHDRAAHRHPCSLCGYIETSLESLRQHMSESHVACLDCDMHLRDAKALHRHRLELHAHRCPLPECTVTVSSSEKLLEHQNATHALCSACGHWLRDDAALVSHCAALHPQCGTCGGFFASEQLLKQHVYARIGGRCVPSSPANVRTASLRTLHRDSGGRRGVATATILAIPPAPVAPAPAATWHANLLQTTSPTPQARPASSSSFVATSSGSPAAPAFPTKSTSKPQDSVGVLNSPPRPVGGSPRRVTFSPAALGRTLSPSPAATLSYSGADPFGASSLQRRPLLSTNIIPPSHRVLPAGSVRWVDPPRSPGTPLRLARSADTVGWLED